MRTLFLAAVILAGLGPACTEAASLRVAPVLIDLKAPAAASSLRIWNDAKSPINVQVRIFRWKQSGGKDSFEPATDVVVSPPFAKLTGGGENMIRVVRTSKQPVRGEESYRVIVDELPQAAERGTGTVSLVIRHSIPVFFSASDIEGAKPGWSVARKQGGYQLSVENAGDRRLRIADLQLQNPDGSPVAAQGGLVGYVLGRSAASWFIPATGGKTGGGTLTISAQSDAGGVNAKASVRGD